MYIRTLQDMFSCHIRRPAHSRHSTYPPPPPPSAPLPPPVRPRSDPLPPPLLGCKCSVCNSQQSLGAFTIGSRHPQQHQQQPHFTPHLTKYIGLCLHVYISNAFLGLETRKRVCQCTTIHAVLIICRSGQQILLGDRVIVKGEKPGNIL